MLLCSSAGGALAGLASVAVVRASSGELTAGVATTGLVIGTLVGVGAAAPAAAFIARGMDRLRRSLLDGEIDDGPPDALTRRLVGPLMGAVGEFRERSRAETRRATAGLRELEVRWRVSESERRRIESTIDSLRDAVIVTDNFDELTMANDAAASLLHFDRATCAHKPLADLIQDEMLATLIHQARESGSLAGRKTVEYDLGASGGQPRSFDITLACLPDHSGEAVGGVVTILRDVTREKEISQMKSDFVSQVSHELRTPLASINAYVEMLVDGEAKDETSRTEFYQIIKNEADRLGRLIDNMLNISRIEAGIIQVERTEVDFVEVAKEVVEVMQPQAKLKNITLLMRGGPSVYTAQACRDMMHQVILNLVSNAVKYTPEGGRVTVAVENDDASRSTLVTVSDTGLGIPPDALPHMFQKFYRIENYKRVAKGTGLGLHLVKHIVETVHGGQIGVQSTVGMGSKFWFTIPFEASGRIAA